MLIFQGVGHFLYSLREIGDVSTKTSNVCQESLQQVHRSPQRHTVYSHHLTLSRFRFLRFAIRSGLMARRVDEVKG